MLQKIQFPTERLLLDNLHTVATFGEQALWDISTGTFAVYDELQNVMEDFAKCSNDSPSPLEDAVAISNPAVVHLWRIIMGNYTYEMDAREDDTWIPSNKFCSNGEVLEPNEKNLKNYSTIRKLTSSYYWKFQNFTI